MLKKHRYKKHEINTGQDSSNIDFLSANRQFDKYLYSTIKVTNTSIYDSYKTELAAKTIKSVKLSNFTEVYSLTNEKKIDVDNLTQKYLYKQFVTWSCNGSSAAPLRDYINNPIYQELSDEDDYFQTRSDARIFLDLRAGSGYTTEAE